LARECWAREWGKERGYQKSSSSFPCPKFLCPSSNSSARNSLAPSSPVRDAPRDVGAAARRRRKRSAESFGWATSRGTSALLGTVESRLRMLSLRGSKQCHTQGHARHSRATPVPSSNRGTPARAGPRPPGRGASHPEARLVARSRSDQEDPAYAPLCPDGIRGQGHLCDLGRTPSLPVTVGSGLKCAQNNNPSAVNGVSRATQEGHARHTAGPRPSRLSAPDTPAAEIPSHLVARFSLSRRHRLVAPRCIVLGTTSHGRVRDAIQAEADTERFPSRRLRHA